MKIKVGSRDSKLAVIQSEMVISQIRENFPDAETSLITMKTTGDIILDKTLDKIGGKGLFVKELERALENSDVDITVHSFKDVPMQEREDLPIVAVSKREDPRDCLILPTRKDDIDFSKPIGCSSQRRQIQLRKIYPNATIAPIRGNVGTRLSKLDNGEFSAIVLAVAGIKRLGLESRISRIFSVEEIMPAACQGILALQARADFPCEMAEALCDSEAFLIAKAERAFVRELDGGCSSPVAAYATIENGILTLEGLYVDTKGEYHKQSVSCAPLKGDKFGKKLAAEMKRKHGGNNG